MNPVSSLLRVLHSLGFPAGRTTSDLPSAMSRNCRPTALDKMALARST